MLHPRSKSSIIDKSKEVSTRRTISEQNLPKFENEKKFQGKQS